jgi:hypothetical protein
MALHHIIAATDFPHRAVRAVSRAAMLASEHHATLALACDARFARRGVRANSRWHTRRLPEAAA